MGDPEAYERAKSRVEAKIGFFIHLAIYVVVNVLLIIINLNTDPEYLWFKWPLIGWGVGVIFHAVGVFFLSGGSMTKERMIEKEMKKQASRSEKH
jgi:hypothetical protein